MKNKEIKLNNEVSIDIPELIQSGMVILANSGGGKSFAIRRIVEQAVEKVQTIVIDPEGEFSSLREKYDFILAGKNADVPVEVRSATLLATKLLQLGKSAVIDLYELHPQERQRFVKLFCEAIVNCPKELYHPVLIILDEAHDYVPEGKPSEATWAVESLASKGRKRGQRLILASQRISKISKNATAECNNKLIGRASQDIDMKRAGDELGFSKEQMVQLRQLKPGEFFAFGPAISDEVQKIKVGEVKTSHAKVGYHHGVKVPPPSDVIKKVLGEIKDLPQEAEKELKTIAEIKQALTTAQKTIRDIQKGGISKEEMESHIKTAVKSAIERKEKEHTDEINKFVKLFQSINKIIQPIIQDGISLYNQKWEDEIIPGKPHFKENIADVFKNTFAHIPVNTEDLGIELKPVKTLGKCSTAIVSFLVANSARRFTKTQVAVATLYSQNSGGFNNAISEACSAKMIARDAAGLLYSLIEDSHFPEVEVSLERWSEKLGACSKKIWELLLSNRHYETWAKDAIAEQTGYSVGSGGFNNSLSELSSLGLVVRLPGGNIKINPEILEI